ncbi:hypothetical protein ACRQ5D_29080 [Mucilaginibacter sp. P25]|uniref:hypothetical protein n=1 Tax=Mucilaginibacter sp. P25 TaxID=3423945 RepID=UPI003D78BD70
MLPIITIVAMLSAINGCKKADQPTPTPTTTPPTTTPPVTTPQDEIYQIDKLDRVESR